MNLVAKLRFFMETPMQREEMEVVPAKKMTKGIQKNTHSHANKENFVSHTIRRSLY